MLLKDHIQLIKQILGRCGQRKLSMNIKSCIFSMPIRIILGHVISKEKIKVDMEKMKVVLYLKPQMNEKKIKMFLGHKRYCRIFIRHYSDIKFQIRELFKEICSRCSKSRNVLDHSNY